MKFNKLASSFFFILLSTLSFSQGNYEIKPGLLRASITLSPSHIFESKSNHLYLHGFLEYYIDSKYSLAGEAYFYQGQLSRDPNIFQFNHQLFFGGSRHFIHNQHDLFVGIQPGISISQLDIIKIGLIEPKVAINPMISLVAGYNFYLNNIFHVFVQSRLNTGQHLADQRVDLSDFRLSAGLGFHLKSKKDN